MIIPDLSWLKDYKMLNQRNTQLEWQNYFNKSTWDEDWFNYVRSRKESISLRDKQTKAYDYKSLAPFAIVALVLIAILIVLSIVFKHPFVAILGVAIVSLFTILAHCLYYLLIDHKRRYLNSMVERYEEKWNLDADDTTMQDYYEEYMDSYRLPPKPEGMYSDLYPSEEPSEDVGNDTIKKEDFFEALDLSKSEEALKEKLEFDYVEDAENDDYDYTYNDDEFKEDEKKEEEENEKIESVNLHLGRWDPNPGDSLYPGAGSSSDSPPEGHSENVAAGTENVYETTEEIREGRAEEAESDEEARAETTEIVEETTGGIGESVSSVPDDIVDNEPAPQFKTFQEVRDYYKKFGLS